MVIEINNYIERTEYNNTISIKIIIPGSCNANCEFCYMKTYEKNKWDGNVFSYLYNFKNSLNFLLNEINGKNPVSIDITGNEPTCNNHILIKVLDILKEYKSNPNVSRIVLTTNGYRLEKISDYLVGVVDYVNISIHDFDERERKRIMQYLIKNEEIANVVSKLYGNGIRCSAVAVIHKQIPYFEDWLCDFIIWCKAFGFISLRLRCDTFWNRQEIFDAYMTITMHKPEFKIITHENTPDSHWCRLRMKDKFKLFFLHGVMDTQLYTKGIEYIIHDDGKCYCDYYKKIPIENYKYEIGKIFDYEEDKSGSRSA